MNNIFLIGYMGTGKTTVSHVLGRLARMLVVDLDEEVEAREGRTINEIFQKDGEAYFRELETRAIREYEKRQGYVVSCGGGAPLREENAGSMRKAGMVVLLAASPKTVYQRVKGSSSRPLLNDHMNEDYIAKMMEAREPYYRQAAHITVGTDNRTPEEIAGLIYDEWIKLKKS